MLEQAALKTLRCPTCGAPLKSENNSDAIACVYCGNIVVPTAEAAQVSQQGETAGFSGTVKVEGIKTPSSALAYIEQFFEEYDWEAFAYAQTLSVAEMDKLANSLKISSADDKNTWITCFKAISVPFVQKVAGCKRILDSVIEEYKKDNLDAYSRFDAYKRIATMLSARKDEIIVNLERVVSKAAKYGASAAEVKGLSVEIDNIKKLVVMGAYSDIEEIPEIERFLHEKNAKIVEELAAKGIQAEVEYARAKILIHEKNYVEALRILLALKDYADTKALIEKIDRYYLISDVLEIEGILYYFKKDKPQAETLNLYPAAAGKVSEKAIIKNIGKMITNHADILYYLDGNCKLKQYNLSTKVEKKIFDKPLDYKSIFVYGRKVFLLVNKGGEYGNLSKNDVVVLDLISGTVGKFLENIREIVSLTDNQMVFTFSPKDNANTTITNIVNVDTRSVVSLGKKALNIEGFVNDYVVYTQKAPNDYNKNLYVKSLKNNEPEKLIEQNIFKFCDIIADKLFYYVGNSRNQSLINVNCDGTGRKEWPLYISDVLFEQGGWVYFIRKAGYNAILCKSRLDGSKFSIIAADIEKFIDIKNGYLYYINDVSALVKVRMDGSNLQKLCDKVESVLSVQEDKIIFVSIDDKITVGAFEQTSAKIVKSIYAVDFTGSGKIKLAYNIKVAQEYDENTVYYIAAKQNQSPENWMVGQFDMLYKLDVETYANTLLLEIKLEEKKQGCYIATCVYGSYDCPQVWTLRRYRDDILASTWYGRAFIRAYYAISPLVVKWFGHHGWFTKLWQGKLDRMVRKLQAQGLEDTPYEDKNW